MTAEYAWWSDDMPDEKAEAIVRGIRRWLARNPRKLITIIIKHWYEAKCSYVYDGDGDALNDILVREDMTMKTLWVVMDAGVWLAGDIGNPGEYFYEDWSDLWLCLVYDATDDDKKDDAG